MPKSKILFACSSCGTTSPKWEGKCPGCGEWNTMIEELYQTDKRSDRSQGVLGDKRKSNPKPERLSEIETKVERRIQLHDEEFNRVLGGGLVPGAITLIGGQPGIGKSTLLLAIALKTPLSTLYVSGEESKDQIKRRATRLGAITDNCLIYNETNIDVVLKTCLLYTSDAADE